MIHWDHATTDAKTMARLGALRADARRSFALGSLYHAYMHERATPDWAASDPPLVPTFDQAFELAWRILATKSSSSLDAQRNKVIASLDRLAPDEDSASIPGQADLVDGVVQLLALGAEPTSKQVLNIASYAYQAITEVALGCVSGDEEDFLAAEKSSEVCLGEIDFQLAYLGALERIGEGEVGWQDVIAMVGARTTGA